MISAEQRLKRKGRILLAQFFERDMLEGEGHAGAHYRGGLVLADRRLFAHGVPRTGRRDGGEVYPEIRGVVPVIAVDFLLVGGFLSFKAYSRK
jgi:hypothetical protein